MRFVTSVSLFAGLALTSSVLAQSPATRLEDVRFPFESVHASVRLQVAARLCDPAYEPQTAAGIIAAAGTSEWSPLGCAAGLNAVRAHEARWQEALLELQRLHEDVGDALAPIQGSATATRSSIRVRDACHLQLAALPPAVLVDYRRRVDAAAERLLQLGQSDRDAGPLQRLVSEYFCSRHGDAALDLLGDLAFERGDFAEALHWWRLLAPLDEHVASLRYPDPRCDVAGIHAKQVIAAIFLGDRDQCERQLAVFAKRYPAATGKLAGRSGKYIDILRAVDAETTPRIAQAEAKSWNTFAGSFTRNRMNPQSPNDRLWAHGYNWRIDKSLPDKTALQPIIVGGRLLINSDRAIHAFDLRTGQTLQAYDLKSGGHLDGLVDDAAITLPLRKHSLSADGKLVCACLSAAGLEIGLAKERSFLVCLELSETAKIPEAPAALRERWHVLARGTDDSGAFFEGAPVMHNQQIDVAMSRRLGKRLHTTLSSFDMTGQPRWTQPICDVFDRADSPGQLLTLASPYLIYCSHSGAVVAVERSNGKPVWALRYLSAGEATNAADGAAANRNDDPRPCLFSNGRVFVAPLDCRSIFCLEATSGRILWEREGITVTHLLGVASGRLIVTTPFGIRGLDEENGDDAWLQPVIGRLGTSGRGFLAGGWVFWPTQDQLLPVRSLGVQEGEQEIFRRGAAPLSFDPTRLRTFQPGNILYTADGMVVAGQGGLFGYSHK